MKKITKKLKEEEIELLTPFLEEVNTLNTKLKEYEALLLHVLGYLKPDDMSDFDINTMEFYYNVDEERTLVLGEPDADGVHKITEITNAEHSNTDG